MTDEELRARQQAATPLPWAADGSGGIQMDGVRDGYIIHGCDPATAHITRRIAALHVTTTGRVQRHHDATYIVAACNAVPGLLDRLANMVAEVTEDNHDLAGFEMTVKRLEAALEAAETRNEHNRQWREEWVAERKAYEASAPLCEKHKPNGGTRSVCLVCALIEDAYALSRIDYLCGEPNEYEVSSYDVSRNPEAVVEHVRDQLADVEWRVKQALASLSEAKARLEDWRHLANLRSAEIIRLQDALAKEHSSHLREFNRATLADFQLAKAREALAGYVDAHDRLWPPECPCEWCNDARAALKEEQR